jgi:hypothetical protein
LYKDQKKMLPMAALASRLRPAIMASISRLLGALGGRARKRQGEAWQGGPGNEPHGSGVICQTVGCPQGQTEDPWAAPGGGLRAVNKSGRLTGGRSARVGGDLPIITGYAKPQPRCSMFPTVPGGRVPEESGSSRALPSGEVPRRRSGTAEEGPPSPAVAPPPVNPPTWEHHGVQ